MTKLEIFHKLVDAAIVDGPLSDRQTFLLVATLGEFDLVPRNNEEYAVIFDDGSAVVLHYLPQDYGVNILETPEEAS